MDIYAWTSNPTMSYTTVVTMTYTANGTVTTTTNVPVAIPAGVAALGSDFQMTTGTFTVPAGETVLPVNVTVFGNTAASGDKRIRVLAQIQGVTALQDAPTVNITIRDDDIVRGGATSGAAGARLCGIHGGFAMHALKHLTIIVHTLTIYSLCCPLPGVCVLQPDQRQHISPGGQRLRD